MIGDDNSKELFFSTNNISKGYDIDKIGDLEIKIYLHSINSIDPIILLPIWETDLNSNSDSDLRECLNQVDVVMFLLDNIDEEIKTITDNWINKIGPYLTNSRLVVVPPDYKFENIRKEIA